MYVIITSSQKQAVVTPLQKARTLMSWKSSRSATWLSSQRPTGLNWPTEWPQRVGHCDHSKYSARQTSPSSLSIVKFWTLAIILSSRIELLEWPHRLTRCGHSVGQLSWVGSGSVFTASQLAVASQLASCLHAHLLIPQLQSTYRRHHSTETIQYNTKLPRSPSWIWGGPLGQGRGIQKRDEGEKQNGKGRRAENEWRASEWVCRGKEESFMPSFFPLPAMAVSQAALALQCCKAHVKYQ